MKAYRHLIKSEQGQKWQLLTRYKADEWEHCDYAKDNKEKNYLLSEYRMAYGSDFEFKVFRV